MSVGPLTDNIVTLNLPMVTAVNYAKVSFMMEFGLSDMLQTVEVSWAGLGRGTSSPLTSLLSPGEPLCEQDCGRTPV